MAWQPNALEEQRLSKVDKLLAADIDPYPSRSQRTYLINTALKEFSHVEAESGSLDQVITLCGRIVSIRDMGKTVFANLEDESGKIQLYIRRDEIGEDSHKIFRKLIDLGDFVEASGIVFRTRMGEISLRTNEWRLLSKAITPLPLVKEQEVDGQIIRYSPLSDKEERYRQRYADLAVNPEVRDVFRIRARLIRALRTFFDENGFLEVETPIMQPLYGGAAAKPFTTHHNQLKQELFLRISFELYLKRLLVGGYERVYEIGRDFRNEGVDAVHNPEFTQLEFYAAYWDYQDVMTFTEEMLASSAQELFGQTEIPYQGKLIELAGPWHRTSLREAIQEYSSIDYMEFGTEELLAGEINRIGGRAPNKATWGKLIDGLLGDYVEPNLIQPTIVFDFPRDISPLAKEVPGDPIHVERFEFFIGGMEMGNAFTELNDPLEQRKRFEDMQRLYAFDEEEAHPIDEDYIRAMRYGMPPNGGFGMGVDRLAMLFTDKTSIREVLLFPHLRERAD